MLHAQLRADGAAHQRDIGDGRTAFCESCRCLDEIRARGLRRLTRSDLFVVSKESGFDDDLADDVVLVRDLDD